MTEEQVNLWDVWEQGIPICITTNGFIRHNGECVMGRGCAAEAKRRFPALPAELGAVLREAGNHVYWWPRYGLARRMATRTKAIAQQNHPKLEEVG